MESIRVAICDDEENIVDIMLSAVRAAFAKRGVSVEIETFTSAEPLWRSMKLRIFDLLFLDIEMPKIDGIEFGERLRRNNDRTEIVYVSAREDRVFDAFKVRPFDFIRKSNFLGDLSKVINNYLAMLESRKGGTVTVLSKSGIMNVPLSDVKYFEGYGKTQLIHLAGKKETINVNRSMEKLEEDLGPKGFIRIHKGILVNYRFISRILVSDVELTDGEVLPLSRRKVTAIKARYLELLRGGGSVIL
ncbi:MAG TPA: LytTR family DNA-binding domain-containing protein [Firmicutes bacterium]|nr:LytTR family DNA-binding domain-containing protein [Bacillota bacterium]